jgi:hypothetical protein
VGLSIRYAFLRNDYSDNVNAATAAAHGTGLMLLDNPTSDCLLAFDQEERRFERTTIKEGKKNIRGEGKGKRKEK